MKIAALVLIVCIIMTTGSLYVHHTTDKAHREAYELMEHVTENSITLQEFYLELYAENLLLKERITELEEWAEWMQGLLFD